MKTKSDITQGQHVGLISWWQSHDEEGTRPVCRHAAVTDKGQCCGSKGGGCQHGEGKCCRSFGTSWRRHPVDLVTHSASLSVCMYVRSWSETMKCRKRLLNASSSSRTRRKHDFRVLPQNAATGSVMGCGLMHSITAYLLAPGLLSSLSSTSHPL